jgi:hypothetical protein
VQIRILSSPAAGVVHMSQILSYLLSVATKPVAGSRDMTSENVMEMSWKCHEKIA